MKSLNLAVNLAVSLFLVPTPGLLILLYVNGGTEIPPLPGLAVMALSAAGYWLWLINRRNRAETERAVAAARNLDPERVQGFGASDQPVAAAAVQGGRSREHAALRGHQDLADPLAVQSRRPPEQVLVDRIADLRQLKSLVSANEVALLNHFHRTVRRDEFGAPDYGDWAYEADRFLMSSSFMARTLNRHEAIATVTAEVEHLAQAGRRRPAAEPRKEPLALPSPAAFATAPEPAELVRAYGGASSQTPARSAELAESILRRVGARRSQSFAHTCAEVLRAQGWDTQETDSAGADGIDLFAERGDLIVGLRARFSEDAVSEEAVSQVLGARERFGLDGAGIVSSSGFTKSARALATVNGICLLDEADLPDLHLFVGHRRKVVPLFRAAKA